MAGMVMKLMKGAMKVSFGRGRGSFCFLEVFCLNGHKWLQKTNVLSERMFEGYVYFFCEY